MALISLTSPVLFNDVSTFGGAFQASSPSAQSGVQASSAHSASPLPLLTEDSYTSAHSVAGGSSQLGLQASSPAENDASSQLAALLATASNALPSGSSEQSGAQSGQTSSSMASLLKTTEQDGVAVAQWMKEQATLGDSTQAASAAAGDSMTGGASLVATFSNDLNQLGGVLNQTAAGASQMQGVNASQSNAASGTLQSGQTLDALSAIGNAIDAQMSVPGQDFTFGFSDSALSATGGASSAASSQLSLHISNYDLPSNTTASTNPYDFAVQFDSTTSTATASEAASVAGSDGASASINAASAASVENFTMNTTGETQTGAGQSTLTTASMRGSIANAVAIGVATVNDGASSSRSVAEVATSSLTESLAMVSTTVNSTPSGNTDAALMKNWMSALALSAWNEPANRNNPGDALLALFDGMQSSASTPTSGSGRNGEDATSPESHSAIDLYA